MVGPALEYRNIVRQLDVRSGTNPEARHAPMNHIAKLAGDGATSMFPRNTKWRALAGIPLLLLLALPAVILGCTGKSYQENGYGETQAVAQKSGAADLQTVAGAQKKGDSESQATGSVPVSGNARNVGVVEIPDVSGFRQVVALSDPHGMFKNLTHLLSACKLTTSDSHWLADRTLLLVVGDSIDKGPQSLEVLDLWRTLSAEAPHNGSRVIVLLGNHEAEFLADSNTKKAATLRDELEAKGLDVRDLIDPARPRAQFLRSLPLAARVGKHWLFCHAGWIPRMPYADFVLKSQAVLRAGDYGNGFLIDPDSILEKRLSRDGDKWWESAAEVQDLKNRLTQDGLYGVVFGHQPEAFGLSGTIGAFDAQDARLIKIDSGMSPEAGAHPGHLLQFTVPDELTHDKRPAHIFSSGFDDGDPELRTQSL
jgi:hypothetical protein